MSSITPRRILLRPGSSTGAQGCKLLIRLLKPLVLSPFVRQNLRRYLSVPNYKDLVVLKELVESGKLTPVIDETCPLIETPVVLVYIEEGHARRKAVIIV